MKKFVLTIGIVSIFLTYSYVLRNQHSGLVIAPSSLSQGGSPSNNLNPSSGNTVSSGTGSPTASSPSNSNGPGAASSQYKDGTYNGNVENAYYGNVQVSATIQGGKITAVNFLEYPNDNPNSINVNQQAMPYLKQEAIQAQSANVNTITGATFTSQAFTQSLSTALKQAMQG